MGRENLKRARRGKGMTQQAMAEFITIAIKKRRGGKEVYE